MTTKTRIAFVPFLPVADRGGQINLLRLVEGLDRDRFESVVLAPQEGPLAERARASGAQVEVIEIPPRILRSPRDFFLWPSRSRKLLDLRRALERLRPDVMYVDAAYHVRAVAHAARPIGAKIVWHVQVGAPSRHDHPAAGAADVIATVSESADALLKGLAVKPVRIPCAVDTNRFHAADEPTLRAERGLREDETVLLFVGGLEPQKGVYELAQAMGHLKKRAITPRLLLVGRGDRAPLERLLVTLGINDQIDWVGTRSDVERFYRIANLFVFPSRTEGLPLAVLEAMASGLPCVATDIPGVHGLLEEGRGVLVPLGDPMAMAEAIARTLADPEARSSMAKAALSCALERYRVEQYVASFDRLFTNIVNDNDVGPLAQAGALG